MSDEGTIEKLVPGEFVRIDIPATKDAARWWDVAYVLLSGGPSGVYPISVHVGVTAHDLVIAEMDAFGRPPTVRRIPLEQVKVVKFKEAVWADEIVLDLGEPQTLRLTVAQKRHDLTLQLIDMLGGAPGLVRADAAASAGSSAFPAPTAATAAPRMFPAYLAGTGGAIGGHFAGYLLNGTLHNTFGPTEWEPIMALIDGGLCVLLLGGCLFAGWIAALLGRRLSQARPNLVYQTSALMGAAMLIALWILAAAAMLIVPRVAAPPF